MQFIRVNIRVESVSCLTLWLCVAAAAAWRSRARANICNLSIVYIMYNVCTLRICIRNGHEVRCYR